MRLRIALIALSIALLVAVSFFLGRWTAPKKKVIVKKQAVRVSAKKALAPSPAVRSRASARIAIVMDDFGYNTNNLEAIYDIKEPVTFSILPNLRHSRDVAESARKHGYETILHLPVESHRKDVKEEPGTLKVGMSTKNIDEQLAKDIESIPGLSGASNHMGSKGTEDRSLMTEVLTSLKKKGLYFFDSLTSEKSVCSDVASQVGIRFAKRDVFLDNSNDVEKIESELRDLKTLALKRGRAIAICHDRKNTVTALARVMPDMAKDGIEFVSLSQMVR